MPKAASKKNALKSLDPKDLERGKDVESYSPKGDDKKMLDFLAKRIPELKEARKKNLPGLDYSIEKIWADADREFTPHELNVSNGRKGFISNEDTGLRSRRVRVGEDDDWQSNTSDPVFYVKVSTALAVLIDLNPEAVFLSQGSRYEANRKLAYANWKASWEKSNAKQQVKLFAFNLAKYGTAYGKTYPKIIETQKEIIKSVDPKTKKRTIETKRLVKYNDLCRSNLNVWKVWTSEMARPGDQFSMDDWYHEEDYSWDRLHQEFPESEFPEMKFVKKGSVVKDDRSPEVKDDKDTTNVTVGFYENQIKDKYSIWIPEQKIVLYQSPLTNDDGMISLWTAPWTLRHDESTYGIGIYEIIRQDAALYDRLKNMTVDQLTLAIYKMFFHKGLDQLGQNGKLIVSAGEGVQVSDPSSIKFLEVPGPGAEAWKGLQFIQDKGDTNSGVPVQLTGKFAGNTLGQDIQAKETALQRMKLPLDFLLDALQQEAYISLSWLKQILSTPEILEWSDEKDLEAALREMGLNEEEVKKYLAEATNPSPSGELVFNTPDEMDEETGEVVPGKKGANIYREVPLNLEQDDEGELIESEESRFYRFGVDLPLGRLDWKGIVRIKPQSVLAPSKDLEKRNDLDLYNLVFPSIQAMAENPMLVPVLMPPIKQIVKIFEKDIKDWIDEEYFQQLFQAASAPKPPVEPEVKSSVTINFKDMGAVLTQAQEEVLEKFLGIKVEKPLFIDANGPKPGIGAPTSVAAPQQESNPAPATDPSKGVQGIKPIAPIGRAPSSLGDAVSGAMQEQAQ